MKPKVFKRIVEDSKWKLILSMISFFACILMIFTEGWFAGLLFSWNLFSTIVWSLDYFSEREVYYKEVRRR